jgi:hypothetical protein
MRDILRRDKGGENGACAGESAVAAYLEGALTAAERNRFEQHASLCTACQELIGLSIKMSEEAAGGEVVTAEATRSGRTVLFRLSIPVIGLAVAGLFVVAGVLVFRHAYKAEGGPPALQVADARLSTGEARKPAESPERVSPAFSDAGRPLAEKAQRAEEAPLPAASAIPLQQAKAAAAAPFKPAVPTKVVSAESDAVLAAQDQAAVRPAAPASSAVNEPAEERAARQAAAPAAEAVGAVGGVLGAPGGRSEAKFDQVRLGKETPPGGAGGVQRLRTALNVTPAREKGMPSATPPDPRQVLLNFAAETETRGKDEAARRAIGDRVFHARGSYWIDQNCMGLQDAEIVWITRGSSDFQSIIERYPGLQGLLEPGKSVLLSWEGKVYLVR